MEEGRRGGDKTEQRGRRAAYDLAVQCAIASVQREG